MVILRATTPLNTINNVTKHMHFTCILNLYWWPHNARGLLDWILQITSWPLSLLKVLVIWDFHFLWYEYKKPKVRSFFFSFFLFSFTYHLYFSPLVSRMTKENHHESAVKSNINNENQWCHVHFVEELGGLFQTLPWRFAFLLGQLVSGLDNVMRKSKLY